MLTQSQYSDFKFVGKLENIKHFNAAIKAINFDETGTFQICEDGFRILVENSKFIQANLFITKECFEEFYVSPDETIRFSVNLNVITECLSIFSGVDCRMKIVYKGRGSPLILILEHHGDDDVTTECSIKTKYYEEPTDYEIDENSPSYNYICIRGPDLSNLFNEIDKTADELEITLSPREPHFKIKTIGVMQSESNVEVAKSSDMMLLFNCRELTVSTYKFSHIRLTMKALSVATKVAIKTDAGGLIELHFMIKSDQAAQIYIQFFITPLVEFD